MKDPTKPIIKACTKNVDFSTENWDVTSLEMSLSGKGLQKKI